MAQSVRFLLVSLVFWALTTTLLACGDDMAMSRGPYRGDFNPAFTGKLGNKVTLRTPDDIGFEMRKTIVDMNINDYDPEAVFDTGAWIVTLNQRTLEPSIGGANPLLARVTWGEGGATTEADVSIAQGASFQVAAGQVRVDIWLEPTNFAIGAPPIIQEVSGFIKRGSLSIGTRRTFFQEGPLGPAATVFSGTIPNFANSFLLYSSNTIVAGGSPAYNADNVITFGAPGFPLVSYNGTQLLAAVTASSPLPIPAGATLWRFDVGAVPINVGNILSYEFFLDF